MSGVDHLHIEAKVLKVSEHFELLSAQYLSRCLEPGNVSNAFTTNNNNNCLKSNIQCIEIRVQWTVHLGSSHMHVHAVTRVHAVTPKLVICVMYLTSI